MLTKSEARQAMEVFAQSAIRGGGGMVGIFNASSLRSDAIPFSESIEVANQADSCRFGQCSCEFRAVATLANKTWSVQITHLDLKVPVPPTFCA
jgi:hypothetical protein